jgi:hypothetical protein
LFPQIEKPPAGWLDFWIGDGQKQNPPGVGWSLLEALTAGLLQTGFIFRYLAAGSCLPPWFRQIGISLPTY